MRRKGETTYRSLHQLQHPNSPDMHTTALPPASLCYFRSAETTNQPRGKKSGKRVSAIGSGGESQGGRGKEEGEGERLREKAGVR